MMWVFDPEIAVARKQYHLLVKVKADREDSTLARRCAKILNTDSPKVHPLSELEDSLVEIEYTDNKACLTRKFVPVRNLSIGDPSTIHPHIIFEGTLKGTIVEHKRSCTNQSCNNRYSKYCVGMGNTTIVTFYQVVIIASGVIMGVPWPDGHSILGRHHRTRRRHSRFGRDIRFIATFHQMSPIFGFMGTIQGSQDITGYTPPVLPMGVVPVGCSALRRRRRLPPLHWNPSPMCRPLPLPFPGAIKFGKKVYWGFSRSGNPNMVSDQQLLVAVCAENGSRPATCPFWEQMAAGAAPFPPPFPRPIKSR